MLGSPPDAEDIVHVGYDGIASVLDRSEAACRQVVHRARERVRGDRKRFEASESAKAEMLRRFMNARDEAALETTEETSCIHDLTLPNT